MSTFEVGCIAEQVRDIGELKDEVGPLFHGSCVVPYPARLGVVSGGVGGAVSKSTLLGLPIIVHGAKKFSHKLREGEHFCTCVIERLLVLECSAHTDRGLKWISVLDWLTDVRNGFHNLGREQTFMA